MACGVIYPVQDEVKGLMFVLRLHSRGGNVHGSLGRRQNMPHYSEAYAIKG